MLKDLPNKCEIRDLSNVCSLFSFCLVRTECSLSGAPAQERREKANALRTTRSVKRSHVHPDKILREHATWVQISEKFKMKVENTAKILKYSILAF